LITDEDREWLDEKYVMLLLAAVDEDFPIVAKLLSKVARRFGHPGIYVICCALAQTIHQVSYPDLEIGDQTIPDLLATVENAADSPELLWASNFVTAYLKGNAPARKTLFFDALKDETSRKQLLGCVSVLIHMAANACRRKEASVCAAGRALTRDADLPDLGVDMVTPCTIPPDHLLIIDDRSQTIHLCASHYEAVCAELDAIEQSDEVLP
jgi:hypothetical protein